MKIIRSLVLFAGSGLALLVAQHAAAAPPPAPSPQPITINIAELPNDGGIRVTTSLGQDVTVLGAESFRIGSLVGSGVSSGVDLYLPRVDNTLSSNAVPGSEFIFEMRESAGGPVSDYIWVHSILNDPQTYYFTVIDFVSDIDSVGLTVPGTVTSTIVENGALQFVGSYMNNSNRPGAVTLNVQSDLDSVPDGGMTAALLGAALLGLAALRRKISRA